MILTPDVTNAKSPLSSFLSPNAVVLAIRLTDLRISSSCNWFALISSAESPAVLAVRSTSDSTSNSRALISCRPPSATEMTLSARLELSIAAVIATLALRSISEAVNPAGSSFPVLMRRPVLSRVSARLRFCWLLPSTRVAIRD